MKLKFGCEIIQIKGQVSQKSVKIHFIFGACSLEKKTAQTLYVHSHYFCIKKIRQRDNLIGQMRHLLELTNQLSGINNPMILWFWPSNRCLTKVAVA